MGVTLKFVFRKLSKDDTIGYVALQRIENRKKTYRSLGLPKFDIRYWDKDRERVKKTTTLKSQAYNDAIDQFLVNIIGEGKSLDTHDALKSKTSFLHYFNSLITGTGLSRHHGTRIKFKTVYNKLLGFLKKMGKDDLLFSELTTKFLVEFDEYMRESGLENNTALHYMKVLKVIFGKSQKEESVLSSHNPFTKYTFQKKEKKLKESLTVDEVSRIIDAELEKERLNKVRLLFLFQFFTGGMRVSDLVTLRFYNLKNGRVNYTMYKTKQPIDTPITEIVFGLLERLVGLDLNIDDLVENEVNVTEYLEARNNLAREKKAKVVYGVSVEKDDYAHVPISVCLDTSTWIEPKQLVSSMTMNQLETEFQVLTMFIANNGVAGYGLIKYDFSNDYEAKKSFYEGFLSLIQNRMIGLKSRFLDHGKEKLNKLANDPKTSNQFVFGRLKNSDFKNIDEKNGFSRVDETQYMKVNKAGISYNRNLKELQKAVGLTKSLSTHMPRTSFANIMVHSGASTMDISKTLGHSSLSITNEYLKTGFNNGRTDEVMATLDDQFQ